MCLGFRVHEIPKSTTSTALAPLDGTCGNLSEFGKIISLCSRRIIGEELVVATNKNMDRMADPQFQTR